MKAVLKTSPFNSSQVLLFTRKIFQKYSTTIKDKNKEIKIQDKVVVIDTSDYLKAYDMFWNCYLTMLFSKQYENGWLLNEPEKSVLAQLFLLSLGIFYRKRRGFANLDSLDMPLSTIIPWIG